MLTAFDYSLVILLLVLGIYSIRTSHRGVGTVMIVVAFRLLYNSHPITSLVINGVDRLVLPEVIFWAVLVVGIFFLFFFKKK